MRHPNVNWVNGMKIKKEHFVLQDNACDDKIKDVAACFLNRFNYGLLPAVDATDVSFRVSLQMGNQNMLTVNVMQCRAVTYGGARVEITEAHRPQTFSVGMDNEIEEAKKGDAAHYYVALTVDLFNRQPFGNPDPDEEPPRYPYAAPACKVSLIKENDTSVRDRLPFSLFIGKLAFQPGAIEIIDDYIPACTSLNSHQKLIDFGVAVEKFYNQMEYNLVSIIRKIREKTQDSVLAESVLRLADKLIAFITANNLKVKWHLPDLPPIYLFENMATFARIVRNTIDSSTAANKEEMLNYFTNWSELKQGDFERLLVRCINFEYNHCEIANSVAEFTEFAQIMNALFEKLESLAYIGKKKETGIFVKEQTQGSKRSFLVD